MRIIILTIIACAFLNTAHAQDELKPLPKPEMAQQVYIDNTSVFSKTFADDDSLNFQVRLPKRICRKRG